MILFEWVDPHTVLIRGLTTAYFEAASWRPYVDGFAQSLQRFIRDTYASEKTGSLTGNKRLLPNSREWNAYKASHGQDYRRGHQFNHIQRAIASATLYQINSLGGGVWRVTFEERALQAIAPHAYWYARKKTNNRHGVLTLNPRWFPRAGKQLKEAERRGAQEYAKKLKAQRADQAAMEAAARKAAKEAAAEARALSRAQKAGTRGAGRPYVRKPLTLALTAWSVTAKCAAKLNLLGRI